MVFHHSEVLRVDIWTVELPTEILQQEPTKKENRHHRCRPDGCILSGALHGPWIWGALIRGTRERERSGGDLECECEKATNLSDYNH